MCFSTGDCWEGVMLAKVLGCCCSNAPHKASVGSSASSVKLFAVDIDSELPSRDELVGCIALVN